MSNYFTADEADLFTFWRMPQALFTNPKYKKISTDAKVLYGLLLDRNSLSMRNNWVDELGRVYIYFSREEAMEMLGCSHGTIPKIFKHLIEVDLIEEKKQGLGKANVIYVKKFIAETIDKSKTSKNLSSGTQKNGVLELKKLEGNNTEFNNTEFSHTQTKNSKSLCVELSSKIENALNEKISQKKIQELINATSLEVVTQYIDNWDKYKPFARQSQASYFIHCIQHNIPVPTPKTTTQNNCTVPQYANFEQREYSEEYYEKFYANLK
jgi:hypothetical protein